MCYRDGVGRINVIGKRHPLAKERIVADLEAAKNSGRRGGRSKAISNEQFEAITQALRPEPVKGRSVEPLVLNGPGFMKYDP